MEEEGKGVIEETNNTTGPKGIVFTNKKKIDQQPNIASPTVQQEMNEILLTNHQLTNATTSTNPLSN